MGDCKVLLVDDEQEFVEALSERLELRDFDTRLALDGEQALEALQDSQPDVMLLDLKMPGIGGMEVLHMVKNAHPGIEVVILTGHGTDGQEEQAKRLGAYAFLHKPVELDRLSEILRAAGTLHQRRALQVRDFRALDAPGGGGHRRIGHLANDGHADEGGPVSG